MSNSIGPTVHFATYNVKNMFDKIDADKKKGTAAKPDREMDALAQVIDRSGAEVIALQEVENKEILQHFVNSRGLSEKFPHVVLLEGNDERGIDVALISKYPVSQAITHKEEKFPFGDRLSSAATCCARTSRSARRISRSTPPIANPVAADLPRTISASAKPRRSSRS